MKRFVVIIFSMLFLMSCNKDIIIPEEINTYDAILGKWEQVAYKENDTFIAKQDGSYYRFSSNWTFELYDAVRKSTLSGSFLYNPQTKAITCKHQDKTTYINVEHIGDNDAVFTILDTKIIIKVHRNGS